MSYRLCAVRDVLSATTDLSDRSVVADFPNLSDKSITLDSVDVSDKKFIQRYDILEWESEKEMSFEKMGVRAFHTPVYNTKSTDLTLEEVKEFTTRAISDRYKEHKENSYGEYQCSVPYSEYTTNPDDPNMIFELTDKRISMACFELARAWSEPLGFWGLIAHHSKPAASFAKEPC